MRTLKYAILGLVSRKPITGYDITKEFNSNALANFWYAKHSQVYPELNKLIQEGLVEYKIVIQGEQMEKKLYSITESGKKEFKEWLLEDENLPPTPKDVFRLKLYFSDFMTKEELILHLNGQLNKHFDKKNCLAEIMKSTYQNIPDILTEDFGGYVAIQGAIIREDYYIDWINQCIALINPQSSK